MLVASTSHVTLHGPIDLNSCSGVLWSQYCTCHHENLHAPLHDNKYQNLNFIFWNCWKLGVQLMEKLSKSPFQRFIYLWHQKLLTCGTGISGLTSRFKICKFLHEYMVLLQRYVKKVMESWSELPFQRSIFFKQWKLLIYCSSISGPW